MRPSDDEQNRPEHSIDSDKCKDEAADKHEVDAPSRRTDDETNEKTTTRQE